MMNIYITYNPKKEKINKDTVLRYISGDMKLSEVADFSKKFSNRITYIINEILIVFKELLYEAIYDYGDSVPAKFAKENTERFKINQEMHFDKIKNFIPMNIQTTGFYHDKNPLYKNIPTSWLYEDFEDQLHLIKERVDIDIKSEKSKNANDKIKILEIQEKIKNKLTEEELNVIFFKSPNEVKFKSQ